MLVCTLLLAPAFGFAQPPGCPLSADRLAATLELAAGGLSSVCSAKTHAAFAAELGGHVVKKRVALPGRGKPGGTRTLVVYQQANKELKALKLLATELLGYTNAALVKAIKAGELIEVSEDG